MATLTTYLLVSGIEQPEEIQSHDLFESYDFKEREAVESSDQELPTLKYALEQPLEEAVDLERDVRAFSAEAPGATVVMCEVEERFDQVERLQLIVFQDGRRGGEVEHGYVFNVGPK
jgi:hypothetical protein